jgi:predicted SAM-dependent methyltransferase
VALGAVELKIIQALDAKRLAVLSHSAPKLHLGCGKHTKPGWVNIDVWPDPWETPRDVGAITINYDLTRGVPLASGTCAEIYSSHFLEHLCATDGAQLLRECHRVLRPGGRLRTCLPDFARVASAYVAGDIEYFSPLYDIFPGLIGDGVPRSDTIIDAVNNVLYQRGEHRCMYDTEKLERLLRAIGFTKVEPSSFDPAIDGDWDSREHFSVYVDAFK